MNLKIILFLLFVISSIFAEPYWGLRNLKTNYNDSVYTNLGSDIYAIGVTWNRLEQTEGTYNWASLVNTINFVNQFNGEIVVVVDIQSPWASEAGNATQPPKDLDRTTSLSSTIPDSGFSKLLYRLISDMVKKISETTTGDRVFLRFENEPQHNWYEGGISEAPDNIEDYLRCLRTFYKAAHDAGDETGLEIWVSHGGLYIDFYVKQQWYELGSATPALQDSILMLFQSRYNERTTQKYSSWNSVASYVSNNNSTINRMWVETMAGQSDWYDYVDIHYHFKPRYLKCNMDAYNGLVQDSGGTLKPYLSAETAMQLVSGSATTPYNQTFHAEDMTRKWITGMAEGLLGICTPVIGAPPENYYGLFDATDNAYQSYSAYCLLSHLIPEVTQVDKIRTDNIIQIRFPDNGLDVVWKDALLDTDNTAIQYDIAFPVGYDSCITMTCLGDTTGHNHASASPSLNLTQEPVIMCWLHSSSNIHPKGLSSTGGQPAVWPYLFHPMVTLRINSGFQKTNCGLKIFDLNGKLVEDFTQKLQGLHAVSGNQITWNTADHPAGLYIIQLLTKGKTFQGKVVVK